MKVRFYKFRGKRVDNGEWVYGFYVPVNYAEPLIVTGADIDDYSEIEFDDYYHVNNKTVGQFTGLTDKNGKKIFEGDIIKIPDCCHRGDAVGFVYYDCNETAYCAKCWGIKYQLGADLSSDSIEIIGNIHDNSELLEV